jgi:hypothetical protein
MPESTPTIVAALVIAAVGGYLGYRICKEKKRLEEMVTILKTDDLSLLYSIDELLAEHSPQPALP